MSSPTSSTDQFMAEYQHIDPISIGNVNSLDPGLNHVSRCEYWTLKQWSSKVNSDYQLEHEQLWRTCTWRSFGLRMGCSEQQVGRIMGITNQRKFNEWNSSIDNSAHGIWIFNLVSSTTNNPLPVELEFKATLKDDWS